VGRKAALWAGIAAVVLGVAGAAIGLEVPGWRGTLTAAVVAGVGTIVAGFVPWFLDRGERRREARRRALLALEPMPMPEPRGSQPGPAFLLRPELAVVPFDGRAAELGELQAWCGPGAPQSVRVLVGAGGVGKTRLAWELAAGFKGPRRDRRRPDADRGAWLVKAGQEHDAVQAARGVAKGLVLLVVDYAETRAGLERLLAEALADPGPVRVLLLARSLGEWWDRLVGESDHDVRQLLRQAPPVQLGAAVALAKSDAELAADAVPCFAAKLKLPAPRVEFELPPGRVPVLVLHAAALVAVLRSALDSAPQQVVVREEGVLEELLTHEERYWRLTAKASGLPGDGGLLKPFIAVAALLGAATQGEAEELLGRVPRLAGASDQEPWRWARWLYELYPRTLDGQLGSLQPDLLAETHVTSQLAGDSDLARACLRDLRADQARRALTVLARAQAHHGEARQIIATALHEDLANLAIPAAQVAVQTWAGLGGLLVDALQDAPASLEALTRIEGALPYPSVILAEARLSVVMRVLKLLPPESKPMPWAGYVQRVAVMLVDLGRPAEGRPWAEKAVSVFGELAEADSDAYRPGLAGSLSNLSILLSQLGLAAEALPPMEEAVTLYRGLVAENPDRYRFDLAKFLDNLGVMRNGLGSTADALNASEEAVKIYRDLVAARPGQYHDGLARSLSNLSNWRRELGQDAAARTAAQEAADIRRVLADADPDRYRPDLAASLDTLGVLLREADQAALALLSAEEAVSVYRDLAGAIPGRYGPDLARSLSNLGLCLDALDRTPEAVAVTEAAVVMGRVMADVNPGGNRPGLANALDNLGLLLGKLGRPVEALAAAEEAVAIRRNLADPDRYRSGLANSMNNLAIAFRRLNRPVEAVAAMEEAVAIRRDLADANPDRYRNRRDLLDALKSLRDLLIDVGRPVESLAVFKEYLERFDQELLPLFNLADELSGLGKDAEDVPAETLADGIDQSGLGSFGLVGVEAVEGGGVAEGDQAAGEEKEQDSGSQALARELASSGSVEHHHVDQQADVPVVDAGDGLVEANRDVADETGGESEHPAFPT
jgi:tetratricopeptide (TPR) repeat protein